MSFIKINGIQFPCPSTGLKFLGSQIVDSARNANGEVVSQKINRRQIKLDSVTWGYLPANTWEAILQEIQKFTGVIEFYSPYQRAWVTMEIYWGDDTGEPLFLDDSGKPISYINCGCNIIDTGKTKF